MNPSRRERGLRGVRRTGLVVAALMLAPVALPADAAPPPTKVFIDNGILHVVSPPGSSNHITVVTFSQPSHIRVEDSAGLVGAAPCTTVGTNRVMCPVEAVARVFVSTDDLSDTVRHDSGLPATLLMGDGNDAVTGSTAPEAIDLGPGDDAATPSFGADDVRGDTGTDFVLYNERVADLRITLDGVANDGERNEGDNIGGDVENFNLGLGNDVLIANDAVNRVEANQGNDTISLRGGDDSVDSGGGADALFGGTGTDTASFGLRYPASRLRVTLDDVADDGEPGEGANVHSDIENLIGGLGNDILIGSAADNVIDGSFGDDRIAGRDGNDKLVGGDGTDLADGGTGTDSCDAETQLNCP